MTDDAQLTRFTAQLRGRLAAAADSLPAPSTSPPAGFLERVNRRRRAVRTAELAALPVVAVVVALAGAIAVRAVAGGGGGGGETGRVEVAQDASGPPAVRDALGGADPEVVSALSPLRRPTVSPVDGGFIVWGGGEAGGAISSGSGVGAMYSEARGSWRLLPASPLQARTYHASVWTGRELVVAGGASRLDGGGLLADAAAYDPGADRWRRLPDLPEPRAGAQAVYAGGHIVVAGGDTAAGTSTVVVGDGRAGWASIAIDHPVHGAAVSNAGVVVYGFDDFEGERAPLELSLVDPATATATPLPSLRPSEEITAEYVGDFAVGARGDEIGVVMGADGTYGLHTLHLGRDLGRGSWDDQGVFDTDERLLPPSRMAQEAAGELILGRAAHRLVTRHGVYELDPGTDQVRPQVQLDSRCAGSRTIDDAARFGSSGRSALYWIDHSCDGRPALAGGEGARLVTFGTDG